MKKGVIDFVGAFEEENETDHVHWNGPRGSLMKPFEFDETKMDSLGSY